MAGGDDGIGRGGAAIIGLAAFALGRCSVSEPAHSAATPEHVATTTAPSYSDSAPAAAYVQPATSTYQPADEADDEPTSDDAPETYYPNCAAARAAGVTPIHEGDPGYASHLDRDRDGVACE